MMKLGLKSRLRLISLVPSLILLVTTLYIVLNAFSEEFNKLTLEYLNPTLLIVSIIWVPSLIMAILGYILSKDLSQNINKLELILKKAAHDTILNDDIQIDIHSSDGMSQAYELLDQILQQTKQDKINAQKASESKSMFLANMSHEIRTPLNGIVGFTELLKDTGLQEEQHEFVEIIESSSENLLEIINNILDLSKIDSDKLEIEDIPFYPIKEFENAVEIYAARASEKRIDFSCFVDPSLNYALTGDPTKVKEILVNLLSNAVKFTSNQGKIDVSIRNIVSTQSGFTKIIFEIQDNGIGVTNEQKSKIFEAFSQADTSITRKYGGTGLGLTISSRFVDLMGGTLDLISEQGEGTTFFFTLNFKNAQELQEEAKDNFSTLKALILKSHKQSKQQELNLCHYLKFHGVDYQFFSNLIELHQAQKKENYDFLFVDYEYTDKNTLNYYNSLNLSLILLTKSCYMKTIDILNLKIYKTIYEPLHSTKIKSILQNYTSDTKKFKQQLTNSVTSHFNAKVLVAEDNTINQKLIKRILEDLGLTITLASNGLEAFQKRKDGEFDLIFMDIQMPYLDGIEATQAILEYESIYEKKHVPIIALTANALKGDREIFLNAGLDEYTAKPLVRTEIIILLNKFLSSVEKTFKG